MARQEARFNRGEAIRFILLHSLGNFLILFSLYGVIATFGPALYYEVQFRVIQARGIHFTVANDVILSDGEGSPSGRKRAGDSSVASLSQNDKRTGPSFADILAGDREQRLIPKDPQFSILIPKIGAQARIFPNVDSSNPKEFLPILQQGIAHAKGNVFPGMHGNIYLFAHSVDNWWNVGRYNAVFYLLKDLSIGDDIIVYFEGKRYDYKVSSLVITEPTDVSFIARDHNGPEQLVLQTCWPPGTTWKRLYVIAVSKPS